jgi:hypothetical protein
MSIDACCCDELLAAVLRGGGLWGEPVAPPVCDVGEEADVLAC